MEYYEDNNGFDEIAPFLELVPVRSLGYKGAAFLKNWNTLSVNGVY
jgi:hypothetical protein